MPRDTTLKVYGGYILCSSVQMRAICLANSQAEVMRTLDSTGHTRERWQVRTHWSISGNDREIAALEKVGRGVLLVCKGYDAPFRRAKKDGT